MIAANYVKHPEAMQHQRELWSKSKRDTILMRIGGLIMRGQASPDWLIKARRKANALAKAVQTTCRDWIAETWHADDETKKRRNFAQHVYAWNASRQKERIAAAAAILRPLLGFQVARAASRAARH